VIAVPAGSLQRSAVAAGFDTFLIVVPVSIRRNGAARRRATPVTIQVAERDFHAPTATGSSDSTMIATITAVRFCLIHGMLPNK